MRFMVWNMRFMTRHVGFIARPIVAWYANQEVIACGLRSKNGEVCVLYTPAWDSVEHRFFKKEKKERIAVRAIATESFSGNLVHQKILPDANLHEVYIVEAKRKNKRRIVRSPAITVKEKTQYEPDLIEIKRSPGGTIQISWEQGERFDPMIYFLVIENDKGDTLAGIYTREYFWNYPFVKEASLSVGIVNPAPLQKDMHYTIKLAVIDFNGWVQCISEKVFTY